MFGQFERLQLAFDLLEHQMKPKTLPKFQPTQSAVFCLTVTLGPIV